MRDTSEKETMRLLHQHGGASSVLRPRDRASGCAKRRRWPGVGRRLVVRRGESTRLKGRGVVLFLNIWSGVNG